jgi:hypothetical protein
MGQFSVVRSSIKIGAKRVWAKCPALNVEKQDPAGHPCPGLERYPGWLGWMRDVVAAKRNDSELSPRPTARLASTTEYSGWPEMGPRTEAKSAFALPSLDVLGAVAGDNTRSMRRGWTSPNLDHQFPGANNTTLGISPSPSPDSSVASGSLLHLACA